MLVLRQVLQFKRFFRRRFIGARFSNRCVDAGNYTKYSDEVLKYKLRGGGRSASSYKTAQKELKEMFSKYKRLSNTISNYNEALTCLKKVTN